jgi:hypothetical protein
MPIQMLEILINGNNRTIIDGVSRAITTIKTRPATTIINPQTKAAKQTEITTIKISPQTITTTGIKPTTITIIGVNRPTTTPKTQIET